MIIGPSNKNVFISSNKKKILSTVDDYDRNNSKSIKDQLSISESAKKTAKSTEYINYVHSLSDIRPEKVAQAKENLKKYLKADGSIEPKVLDNMVNNISKIIS